MAPTSGGIYQQSVLAVRENIARPTVLGHHTGNPLAAASIKVRPNGSVSAGLTKTPRRLRRKAIETGNVGRLVLLGQGHLSPQIVTINIQQEIRHHFRLSIVERPDVIAIAGNNRKISLFSVIWLNDQRQRSTHPDFFVFPVGRWQAPAAGEDASGSGR